MTDPSKKDLENSHSEGRPVDKAKEESADCLELPRDMPEDAQKFIRMAMTRTSMGSMRPNIHPLFEKVNEEHVHKFLDLLKKEDDNETSLERSSRWFHLGYVLIAAILFIFLTVYLVPKDKSLFDSILQILMVFAGGVGSGYGIKSYRDKK